MRLLNYVQVFVSICVVHATCMNNTPEHKNRSDSESPEESDSGCKVSGKRYIDCNYDTQDQNDIQQSKEKYENSIKKSLRKFRLGIKNDYSTVSSILDLLGTLNTNSNESSIQVDSLDREQNVKVNVKQKKQVTVRSLNGTTTATTTTTAATTAAAATEYMEEFRRSANQTTTMDVTTNTLLNSEHVSLEESDESKSTLIDYPFSVSVQKKGAHYASGALLDKLWVVTSAGEFYNVRDSYKLYRARLGSVDCKKGGIIVPFKKIEFHPYFIQGKPNFDVAMLRLAYAVQTTNVIRPIAISTVKGKVLSAKFMTTYWPRIKVKGSVLPKSANERIQFNSMRVSTQRLIPHNTCIKMIKSLNEVLNESTLCLKPVISHHSVCIPDAGAPIIAEDGLWGITSGWTSPKCPDQPAPTVFTRLSSPPVRSWLNTVLLSVS